MNVNIDRDSSAILIVDGEIVSRHEIAHYLRSCGYKVIEAANVNEAYTALSESKLSIDVILLAIVGVETKEGFELVHWVRSNRPELEVKMAGGVEMAAQAAAELCDRGPHLQRPYEPEMIIDYIKRLRASRLSND